MSDSESITTVEIKLSRYIDGDGKLGFRMIAPKNYNAVEALGLLETAKFVIFQEMGNRQ
jgi:hypothetical protein